MFLRVFPEEIFVLDSSTYVWIFNVVNWAHLLDRPILDMVTAVILMMHSSIVSRFLLAVVKSRAQMHRVTNPILSVSLSQLIMTDINRHNTVWHWLLLSIDCLFCFFIKCVLISLAFCHTFANSLWLTLWCVFFDNGAFALFQATNFWALMFLYIWFDEVLQLVQTLVALEIDPTGLMLRLCL